MGPTSTLSQAAEGKLENWILPKAKLGFLMHPDEVNDAVQKILKNTQSSNTFEYNRPFEYLIIKETSSLADYNRIIKEALC